MREKILNEFDDFKSTLDDLKVKMEFLISELIKNEAIQTHQILGRLKERNSLKNKIDRKQDKYLSLHDITDIVGIRVITYLESDVDKIADIIEREFLIDKENSVDKRKLNTDQFGYRSLHYVVVCKDERTCLIEYKRFAGIKFEIQIRSILQHAWAEIEHDLGYKGMISIPEAHKRGFNRLAALLESADLEFDRLKKELVKYEEGVTELIRKQPEDVAIDQASLISFIKSNEIIQKALTIISVNVGCKFKPAKAYNDYASIIDRFKNFFKILTIEDFEKSLSLNEELFLSFINEYTRSMDYNSLSESVVVFYFQHFLAALSEDPKYVKDYLNFGGISIAASSNEFIQVLRRARSF
jgi:ppGpp synthetase/RelA/SpoT-type nucleotidyltranferase